MKIEKIDELTMRLIAENDEERLILLDIWENEGLTPDEMEYGDHNAGGKGPTSMMMKLGHI